MAASEVTATTASCLGEDDLLGLAAGRAPPSLIHRAEEHFDSCESCRLVLVGLMQMVAAEPAATSGAFRSLRTFTAGELVAGRFRIVRLLGRGGMGEVYEAQDAVLAVKVALKTLALDAPLDSTAATRLKVEALLARRITHPNVCRIFDLNFHQERAEALPVLTMELLDGETLASRMRRTGPLPLAEAHDCAVQLAAGLDAAHAAGVVHRDFKPENVMLVAGAKPRAVITDFGLARFAPEADFRSGSSGLRFAGTPGYASPEQLAGRTITARSDIFAFGVVLFEMVSGQKPFAAASPAEVVMRVLSGRPDSLQKLSPGAPAGWDGVIARCLEREPDRRFASGGEVIAALPPASGRPGASLGRAGGRGFGIAAVAGAAALAAAVSVAAGFVWWGSRSPARPPASARSVSRPVAPLASSAAPAEPAPAEPAPATPTTRSAPPPASPPPAPDPAERRRKVSETPRRAAALRAEATVTPAPPPAAAAEPDRRPPATPPPTDDELIEPFAPTDPRP